MARKGTIKIEMIPVDSIVVVNPRVRNKQQHQEIIDSIKAVGLKRPITVSRKLRADAGEKYDLVCGQGRLEAFQSLGYVEIPAAVIEANDEDCLLKSLVENVARRQHSPMELLQEILRMKGRGYSENEIAEKIGMSPRWVSSIVGLLENGEQRLLSAVETGVLPISLAIQIAKSDDSAIQQLLTDAYANGSLRGRKLIAVRRLLERRERSLAPIHQESNFRAPKKKLTADQLRKVYETEAERQRLLIKKAEFVGNKIMFVVHAFKEMMAADGELSDLLKSADLAIIPRQLHERIF